MQGVAKLAAVPVVIVAPQAMDGKDTHWSHRCELQTNQSLHFNIGTSNMLSAPLIYSSTAF